MKALALIVAALVAGASAVTYQATEEACGHGYQCSDDVPFVFVEKFCFDFICNYQLWTPCDSHPCQNGGACVNIDDDHFSCGCVPGYEGDLCESLIDACIDNACVHGTCVGGVNSYTCDCNDGWAGEFCAENIDECASSPCQNGGECHDGINSFTCTCLSGFLGYDCGFPAMMATGVGCGHDYQCSDEVGFDFIAKYCIDFVCTYERALPEDYNNGGDEGGHEEPTVPPSGEWESDGVGCGHDYQCDDKDGFEKACMSFTCHYRALGSPTEAPTEGPTEGPTDEPTTPPTGEPSEWTTTTVACGHDYQCPDDVGNNIVQEKRCNNHVCEYRLIPIFQTTGQGCGHDYQCDDEVGFEYLLKACVDGQCAYQVMEHPNGGGETTPAPSSPGEGWFESPSGQGCGHSYQCDDMGSADKLCFNFMCWYHEAPAPA